MKTYINPSRSQWKNILARPALDIDALDSKVKSILDEVKKKGDSAVIEFTKQFDKVNLDTLTVSENEIRKAAEVMPESLKAAVDIARTNIEKFHLSQRSKTEVIETMPGVKCWQQAVPISKVGLYIPGGLAPLFSTVLMLGIPAVIAGCKEIVLCTPPDKEGNIPPAILFTANAIGITRIFKVGGVQAIGAMAYGTETIPQVYKIFGPGNQYVTAAKQLVNRQGTAIDMPAGPSEVAVIADDTAIPSFVAADLLAQAEHGPDSQVILVASSESIVKKVLVEISEQLEKLPRKEFAAKSLENSKAIVLESIIDTIDIINEYAPEHLIISTKNYQELAMEIENAGSVFLGNYTPESAGDYASGTNHTLPTNGYARAYSGVNLDSYVKKITYQHITEDGLENIGTTIEIMAETEQLTAHKNAVALRMKKNKL
jgi:histidinol dehydrogenase